VVISLLANSSSRQVLENLRDAERGSTLIGVLHLVIATSAPAASVGLLLRTRWAVPFIAASGSIHVELRRT
jgi:hypothetical protein